MMTAFPRTLYPAQSPGLRARVIALCIRNQFLVAILLSVALPAIIRTGIDVSGGSMRNTTVGTFAALIIGVYFIRRMVTYPGVWGLSFVLPSFAFSYLAIIAIFFFARLDYSRIQFGLSFLASLLFFYFVLHLEKRFNRPQLLLLPFGAAHRLLDNHDADWTVAAQSVQLSLPLPVGNALSSSSPNLSDVPVSIQLPQSTSGVVADLRADLPAHWERFLAQTALQGIPVYHCKQISESLTGTVEVEHLSENTFGSLVPSSGYYRFKRFCDALCGIVLAPPVALICAVAAIAIKLDDGGPILFRQARVGYRGQTFTILKFRTMSHAWENGEAFTLKNDERITRVGRLLRLYRIDELPQIVNILRGEMSWIGPRPEAVELAEWYASKIPFYSYRHIVRPGITGWAQVNQGNVARIEAATMKLQYDFFYIKNFSPWLDLLISMKTVAAVFTRFGSR